MIARSMDCSFGSCASLIDPEDATYKLLHTKGVSTGR